MENVATLSDRWVTVYVLQYLKPPPKKKFYKFLDFLGVRVWVMPVTAAAEQLTLSLKTACGKRSILNICSLYYSTFDIEQEGSAKMRKHNKLHSLPYTVTLHLQRGKSLCCIVASSTLIETWNSHSLFSTWYLARCAGVFGRSRQPRWQPACF